MAPQAQSPQAKKIPQVSASEDEKPAVGFSAAQGRTGARFVNIGVND